MENKMGDNNEFYEKTWVKGVPFKVLFFVWVVAQNRIPLLKTLCIELKYNTS